MTTNVFDGNAAVMATDSRWSIRHGKYVIYLDDTGFEKIELRNQHAFMFAGNGLRIQEWKSWIRSDPKDDSTQPAEEGICVCVVSMDTKQVKFSVKQDVEREGGFFAGSGSTYAVPCWLVNKDAKRAVDTAKQSDIFSGGEIKFFNFATGAHNLGYPSGDITIQMVVEAINKRGLAMTTNVNSTQPFPFAVAANDNPELAEIRQKIANGELSANAPCDGMYNEWTKEEKSSLKRALGDVFGWNK